MVCLDATMDRHDVTMIYSHGCHGLFKQGLTLAL
jgi:hypothetical protein